jgi:Flp pilus assembly protein TadG
MWARRMSKTSCGRPAEGLELRRLAPRRAPWRKAWRLLSALRRDARGVAAVEFALIALVLSEALLNVVDVGVFASTKMQLENAAEMGAQAAWTTCGVNQIPATKNCTGLDAAVSAAVQGTSLGTHVTLASGYPSEGYYCLNSTGALVYVASVTDRPSNCSSVGGTSAPADYVLVEATYSYTPLFPGLTVTSAFAGTLSKTTYVRLG